MTATVPTVAYLGLEARSVEVQASLIAGLPAFNVVGLGDKAVNESRERVRGAIASLGLALPPKRITVNLSPADLPKEGSHYDLPIALAVLGAMGIVDAETLSGYVVVGELGLNGRVAPSPGVLLAAIFASGAGQGLICPEPQGPEAAWAGEVEVIAAPDLLSLLNHFKGSALLPPPVAGVVEACNHGPDLSQVKGQETAKRAVEISAAGGHNLLMVGPPGSGKSLMAACIPGILPDLTASEALEVSMVASVAGELTGGRLIRTRPFRSPHHSASMAALTGGGVKNLFARDFFSHVIPVSATLKISGWENYRKIRRIEVGKTNTRKIFQSASSCEAAVGGRGAAKSRRISVRKCGVPSKTGLFRNSETSPLQPTPRVLWQS